MPNVYLWSTDPDSNDTADPSIDWTEGQSPAGVNNSGRAMMAAVACRLRDTNGSLVATGTNAYALQLNSNISDLNNSFEIVFSVDTENTSIATLSVNGQAARPVRRRLNRELGPGDLTRGVYYRALYAPSFGAYVIVSPEIARPGKIEVQAASVIDPGWISCSGQLVSRAAYAALYDAIGDTYGPGDANNFRIPDARGRTVFGVDGGANRLTDAGGLGGALGNAGGSEAVTLTTGQMPSHTHTGQAQSGGGTDGGTTGSAGDHNHGGQVSVAGSHTHGVTIDQGGSHSHSGTANTAGGEARKFAFISGSGTIQGGAQPYVADINASGVFPGNANERSTSTDPGHQHSVTIDQGGAHTHTGSVAQTGDHQHSIAGSGAHTHSLPAAAAHTHPLLINNAGDGGAHSNVPPGLVLQYVIKA